MHTHESLIARCLLLAENGRGKVGNGALVGAVLVRDGKVIGEGWHDHFGSDHAETSLIKNCDQEFRQEDTLYVSLEPCCHTGKTPPCTDRIIQAGIKQVCFGMFDPDTRVAGKGIAALRAAGIQVIGPVLPETCRRFNKGFVSVREQGRPYITLKQARTKNGETANADGSPKKITSKEQDIWSHTFLRSTHDAILVGIGTIRSDNPRLTIRLNKKSDQVFLQPYKIILDSKLTISPESAVCSESPDRTIVITDMDTSDSQKAKMLRALGIMVFGVPRSSETYDWNALWEVLLTPQNGFSGLTSILVEGGPITWNLFHSAGFVDEEVVLIGT